VRALDDNSRGNARRLAEVANDIEFIAGDIRDPGAVDRAAQGLDEIHHLAYVNGSQFFYTQPDLVLDVGVRGMVNVIDACRKHGIGKLVLASSSEVYQTPPLIPTDESAPSRSSWQHDRLSVAQGFPGACRQLHAPSHRPSADARCQQMVFAFSRAAPSMKSQSSPTAASATASSCL
jgi:uncharacterized protein YbjT (DUF2867 family)